uniref:SH3 and cysteine-rich domain-containing protein 2 n=1 Tax=Lygus hesperus TaxID=30085 RepID=A0A146MBV8_LYGHE
MYIISPAEEVIRYTLPNSGTNQSTPYYAARYGGLTQTMESLKGMAHPAVWPNVKTHITTSLAIVKNLSDFAQELSQMYEHHAGELQLLVGNYRKKNAELRKEGTRGSTAMLHLWEALLAEVEADSQAHGEVASVLGRQVSRHIIERTFYRKVEARKLLAHRENLDSVIAKSEDTLSKCRQDYKAAYLSHVQTPGSTASLAAYLDAHNTYVTQLHSTNAMVDTYCRETLPELLTELEDVYADLASTLSEAIAQGAEIISNRAGTQSRRYCTIWNESKEMDPSGDAAVLIRNTPIPAQPHPSHRLRLFTPPQTDDTQEAVIPQLKNTLVTDRPASLQINQGYESLNTEQKDLTQQIQQLQDALSTMLRIQQRSIESSLYNKANEIQEDISLKRYELKTAQINLAAVKARKELFAVKMETADGGSGGPDRKMSSASTSSMKNKWLKAFKSLKTPPPNGKESEKDKNGKDLALATGDSAHQFQEYTYKKITPCDVCSQVLRGHTRQGLKCRLCKMNVHIDCQERVGKCQTKSRLLRRQKSSSEIDGRTNPGDEEGATSNAYFHIFRNFSKQASVTTGGQNSSDQAPPSRSDEPAYRGDRCPERGDRGPERGDRGPERGDRGPERGDRGPERGRRPNPSSSSHHHHPHQPASSDTPGETRRRTRLFGMKGFGFGKTVDRTISLPETETVQYAAGKRPFGMPLVLGAGAAVPVTPPTPTTPRTGKRSA